MLVDALLNRLDALLEALQETEVKPSPDVLKKAEEDFGRAFVDTLKSDPKFERSNENVKKFLSFFYGGYEPFRLAKVAGAGPPENGSRPIPVPKGQALPKNRQDAIEFVNAAALELGNRARSLGLDKNGSVKQARDAVAALNRSVWNT